MLGHFKELKTEHLPKSIKFIQFMKQQHVNLVIYQDEDRSRRKIYGCCIPDFYRIEIECPANVDDIVLLSCLAHEMGHLMDRESLRKEPRHWLNRNGVVYDTKVYVQECIAWDNAVILLKRLGLWNCSVRRTFNKDRREALATYGKNFKFSW